MAWVHPSPPTVGGGRESLTPHHREPSLDPLKAKFIILHSGYQTINAERIYNRKKVIDDKTVTVKNGQTCQWRFVSN